jgi:hypothetical protein
MRKAAIALPAIAAAGMAAIAYAQATRQGASGDPSGGNGVRSGSQ